MSKAEHDDDYGLSYTTTPLFPGKLLRFGGSYSDKFLIVDEKGLEKQVKKEDESEDEKDDDKKKKATKPSDPKKK